MGGLFSSPSPQPEESLEAVLASVLNPLYSDQTPEDRANTLAQIRAMVYDQASKALVMGHLTTDHTLITRLLEFSVMSEDNSPAAAALSLSILLCFTIEDPTFGSVLARMDGASVSVRALSAAVEKAVEGQMTYVSAMSSSMLIIRELFQVNESWEVLVENRAWEPIFKALHAYQWDKEHLDCFTLSLHFCAAHPKFDWAAKDAVMDNNLCILEKLPSFSFLPYRLVTLLITNDDQTKRYQGSLDRLTPIICKHLVTASVDELRDLCHVLSALAADSTQHLDEKSTTEVLESLVDRLKIENKTARFDVAVLVAHFISSAHTTPESLKVFLERGLIQKVVEAMIAEEDTTVLPWLSSALLFVLALLDQADLSTITQLPRFVEAYAKVIIYEDPELGSVSAVAHPLILSSIRITTNADSQATARSKFVQLDALLKEPIEKKLAEEPNHHFKDIKELIDAMLNEPVQ